MADDSTWKENCGLKDDLQMYVTQGMSRKEILDFVKRDYGEYAWSIRTLDRRLRHLDIFYNDRAGAVAVEEVKGAVRKELAGPGKLLGYRAMHKKIRQVYNLNVTRDAVYNVMYDLDPKGLEARGGVGVKKQKVKGHFTSKGSNFVHSLDGHDKLMGYQNSTYPLAIYGCIDTASRKILWLRIWTTNSDPKVIGRWYLEHLMETRTIANTIRLDKGTETGIMATIHAFLRSNHDDVDDPTDTVIYGPSTSNQIERWWKELHERLEGYFKDQLAFLKDHGHYNPDDDRDRLLLAYIMIPVMQRELDIFKDNIWNTHRIRAQKNTRLPDGIPDHMYSFPEEYGLEECGSPVTEAQLQEVAIQSGVLEVDEDFLQEDIRKKCQSIVPHPDIIEPRDCSKCFINLKKAFKTR